MHDAIIFLARERALELRDEAREDRQARLVRRSRRSRSLRDRLRGGR